jgi:hypothetical protein
MNEFGEKVTMERVLRTWWPLAASWLLMGIEIPVLSAIVARLPNPEVNLAAFAAVVQPVAMFIEAPVMMLLSASTALSKDLASYLKMRRFMMIGGATLTAIHALVAFTPIYYIVARQILGAPDEVLEPARLGLMVLTPWTWSIAYRRFNQGVLIRYGHSRSVGMGSVVRLSADVTVLAVGFALKSVPGVVVAACALSFGVMCEAAFAGLRVHPVLEHQVAFQPAVSPVITARSFVSFYFPLMLTSLLFFIAPPIGSAALSRMPFALESLATWTVVTGLIFLFRAVGMAYNEVVVALLDEPEAFHVLRRFSVILSIVTSVLLTLIAVSPVSGFWFGTVSALSPELVVFSKVGLLLGVLLPALTVLQSWFQGCLVHVRKTKAITESVVLYLVVNTLVLMTSVWLQSIVGLYVGVAALTAALGAQVLWLGFRSRAATHSLRHSEIRASIPTEGAGVS